MASPTPSKKRTREREGEHEMLAVKRCMEANPQTDESSVWGKLAGKSKIMVKLRKEFAAQFKSDGFGFVQGSKWATYLNTEEFKSTDSYKTEAQIFRDEGKDPTNTKAKLDWAREKGQGSPSSGRPEGMVPRSHAEQRTGLPVCGKLGAHQQHAQRGWPPDPSHH